VLSCVKIPSAPESARTQQLLNDYVDRQRECDRPVCSDKLWLLNDATELLTEDTGDCWFFNRAD